MLKSALLNGSGALALSSGSASVQGPRAQMCHALIADTAKGFAREIYDKIMWDNDAYKAWKEECPDLTKGAAEEEFVRLLWPKLLDDARAILAKMLGDPGKEHLKPAIHDALIKDATVRGDRPLKPLFFGRS